MIKTIDHFSWLFGFLRNMIFVLTIILPATYGQSLWSQIDELKSLPCCDFSEVPGVVWAGSDPIMTFQELAEYCAPILWFSPDEPLLKGASGTDILIPEPLPWEESADSPIVYFRVRTILRDDAAAGDANLSDKHDVDEGVIDLEHATGIDLDYFFYYSMEEGMAAHKHDTESAYFKLAVWKRENCPDCRYALIVTRVVGRAHGLKWYDNTLEVDKYTVFPMTLLVEEGKHASCTDKNGDGYFTPGYDANRRINDAWGVRDVIRTGLPYSGGFKSWMAKVRREEHRVFPPLPEDSLLRERLLLGGLYAPDNAKYILRSFPPSAFEDPELIPFLKDKVDPKRSEGVSWLKSLSIAYRFDGESGLSFSFPLFIVKNFEDPLAGGFVVHRLYLRDDLFRDFGWLLNYSLSASRWVDGYIAAGVEWDVSELPEGNENLTKTESNFVFEAGVKFRVTLTHTPLKFLTKLTDFWGIRFGIKNVGFSNITKLAYVVEIGAGTW